ncbi:MAG: hypothetical protein ABW321_14805 [Polyangiales bacterium]
MPDKIKIGYQAFVQGRDEEFGAVRAILSNEHITLYVENAGEFVVPRSAITSVQSEKVTFDWAKLDPQLQAAIEHAHDAEDPEL